jgi:hypothetical protein
MKNNFMPTKIINPEGVIEWALEHTIIYWNWAHSRDLQQKWLLPTGTNEHTAHLILLPIITIATAVLELIDQWASQEDMISFGGVMNAPNGTPSVHALWGPAATQNLKVAVAMETFGKWNRLMQRFLELMTAHNVTIIETNKPEHDKSMAVIQGLINLWLVIVWDTENPDIQRQLIDPWKTPIGTIVDMIHANPFSEIIISRFFESLGKHNYDISTALEASIHGNLDQSDLERFWTPNSQRVIDFISTETNRIIVSRESVLELQRELNTYGHMSLARRIREIRWKI